MQETKVAQEAAVMMACTSEAGIGSGHTYALEEREKEKIYKNGMGH